jgi:hypothetical protein
LGEQLRRPLGKNDPRRGGAGEEGDATATNPARCGQEGIGLIAMPSAAAVNALRSPITAAHSCRSSPRMNPPAGVHVASTPRHAGFVSPPIGAGGTSVYEILVRGELSEALASTLGARRFEPREGKTMVVVEVIDQAHLHGILEQLRDLAIDIERVNPV